MSDRMVDLGGVAVLQAHNLNKGNYVVIEGHLFVVDRIEDSDRVVLRPIVGCELFRYRFIEFVGNHKLIVIAVALIVIAAYFFLRN